MRTKGWFWLVLAGCSGSSSDGKVDAPIVIVDAPPDAKEFLDAPPPMFDFSCANNTAPTTAPAEVTITGTVTRVEFTGTLMINPLDGASVRMCAAPGAPNCNQAGNQIGTTQTSAGGGMFSIGPLTTNGAPIDSYLEMTESGSRTTFAYPDQPFNADIAVPVLTFTPQVIGALALIPNGGCTQSAGNGMLGLGIVDCAMQPISDPGNLTISIKQGGNEVQGTTVIDLGAVNGAAAGLYLICNVPPNTATTLGASWNGMQLRAHDVKVVAGTTTQSVLRPGYLM